MGTATTAQVVPDAKTRIYGFNGQLTGPSPRPLDRRATVAVMVIPSNLASIFTHAMTDLVVVM